MFKLHTRLKADTFEIARLELSRMLLMNDKSLPWLILVPERKGVRELDQLIEADRARLMEEIVIASRAIQHLYAPDKMNIGALGNLVPQVHFTSGEDTGQTTHGQVPYGARDQWYPIRKKRRKSVAKG